jgi:hypothetical protein
LQQGLQRSISRAAQESKEEGDDSAANHRQIIRAEALANPSVKDRIIADAGTPMDMPLDEIEQFVKAEIVNGPMCVTSIETHGRWLL